MAQQAPPTPATSDTRNVLQVFVHRAEDLKAGDFGGTSDPYAELRIVSMSPTKEGVFKTKRIDHTVCPEWNETFYFHPLHPQDDVLEIKIYDHNTLSANELLGLTTIPIAALFAGGRLDTWKDLKKSSDQQTKGRGRIHLVITYNGEGVQQLAGQAQLPSVFAPPPQPQPQFQPPGTFFPAPAPALVTPPPPQPQPMVYAQPPPQLQQMTAQPYPGAVALPHQLMPSQSALPVAQPPFVQQPLPPQQPAFVQPQPPVTQGFQQPPTTQGFQQPPTTQGFQQPPPVAPTAGNMGYKVSHASDFQLAETRPMCPYGLRCYRKNPVHFREMAHPPGHPLAQ